MDVDLGKESVHDARATPQPHGPRQCIAELRLALLLEYSSLTPLPVVVCVIVLYSPSSSSLSA